MKKWKKILWGVALIALGVVLALNALNITEIDIFFDGWWTLFIIVPSLTALFTERDKMGGLIGVCIGVAFLLASRDVISFGMIWKLILPVVIVLIGIRLIVGGARRRTKVTVERPLGAGAPASGGYCSVFSGQEVRLDGQVFTGTTVTAVFGGVDLDLRGAIFEQDCEIEVVAVFGGVDIWLPDTVNVETSSVSVFGGMDNKKVKSTSDTAVTVRITGCCIFGGADVQ